MRKSILSFTGEPRPFRLTLAELSVLSRVEPLNFLRTTITESCRSPSLSVTVAKTWIISPLVASEGPIELILTVGTVLNLSLLQAPSARAKTDTNRILFIIIVPSNLQDDA